jgi:glycosyltransferase involved in cell wall biosynthesis
VALIPNGFDTDLFRPDRRARDRIRGELGLGQQAVAVGLVARYHPVKGHAVFLEAAAMLGSARPEASFVLAGPGVGPENRELSERIGGLGLGDRVHLLGERRDVAALMAALDVGCLASEAEGFPNAVGEAMAAGLPCVVTDVGDASFLVGEAGVVVPPRDAAALAAGLVRLLDLGPEGRQRLGEAGRRRVARHFSLAAMLDRYDHLYRDLLGNPRP